MSKLQFRARALDASKPMPIYMAEELPDLTDYSAINRAVPQMPSGMEKEEECEHHLQRAICTGLIIPTPEVASMTDAEAYDKIYPANYKQPKQLIHMQPFTMEQEIPDYDMDSEDEAWVLEQGHRLDITPLKFESMMDRLEKSSGQTVVTIHDAKALLKEDDDLIIAIFDYWLNKRLKTQHPLILAVKTEHRVGSAANNPYLAFRRRTEKMQTRKNRKNDETSYEKMLKLRRDLSRAVTLLEMVKRREKTKREHLHLTIEIVEKRYQAQDFSGALLSEVSALRATRPAFAPLFTNQFTNQNWAKKVAIKDEIIPRKEKRQYKKKKHKVSSRNILSASGLDSVISSDEDDVSNPMLASPDEPEQAEQEESKFAFRRNKNCSYHMPLTNRLGNWPWCSREENGSGDHRYRYTLASIRHPRPRCIGFARRRMGRGGRVILDRLSTPYDDLWREMDFTIIETPSLNERLALKKILADDQDEEVEKVCEEPCDPVKVVDSTALRNLYSEHNYNAGGTPSVPMDIDVKSESDSVRHCGASTSDVRVKEELWTWDEVKTEPCEEESDKVVNSSTSYLNNDDKDEMLLDDNDPTLEILREIKQWTHFRPKTPPADYIPECNLLPAKEDVFNPHDFTQISVEIENLSSQPPSQILCDSSSFTSEFTLNDIYTELNLDYQIHQEEALLAAEGDSDIHDDLFLNATSTNHLFGCSRVTVTNNSDIKTSRTQTNDMTENNKHLCSTTTPNNFLVQSSPTTIRRNIQLVQHQQQHSNNLTGGGQQRSIGLRTPSILSNTLISPTKYNNSVVVNSGGSGLVPVSSTSSSQQMLLFDRITGNVTTSSPQSVRMIGTLTASNISRTNSQDHPHTNGPVSTHLDSASMSVRLNCKGSSGDEMVVGAGGGVGGDGQRVHLLQNNSSSINSQVRRAILTSQTINTLNSNSANLMDSRTSPNETTLINSDNVKMKTIHHIKSNDGNLITTVVTQSTTTSSGTQTNTSNVNNKQQIVRKNNTLAMEVT